MRFRIAAFGVAAALFASLSLAPGKAAAGMEPFIGEVMIFTGNGWCPRGWMPASGQKMPISANQALFSIVGAQFGGDGRTFFNLPALNAAGGRPQGQGLAKGAYYCIAVQGIYPSRG